MSALFVCLFVLVACGASGDSQHDYQGAAASDRSALYDATLSTSFPKQVPVGQPTPFRAFVCGSQAVVTSCARSPDPTGAGSTPTPKVIKAGARLKAELVSPVDAVKIIRLGPDVQPVVVRTDQADWEWSITAGEAGTFRMTLIVTALRADTDDPLMPSSRLDVTFTAQQSTSQLLRSAGDGILTMMAAVASLLAAAGGVAGFAVFRGGRRGRRRDEQLAPHDLGRPS